MSIMRLYPGEILLMGPSVLLLCDTDTKHKVLHDVFRLSFIFKVTWLAECVCGFVGSA